MAQQRKQVFIDASLWSQKWFDDMPIEFQVGYMILWAESDNVGIWRPHFRELNFKLKQEIDPEEFLSAVNAGSKRVEVLENGTWWLLQYLPLQVPNLKPNNRPHVSYIEDLRRHGLLTAYAVANPQHVNFGIVEELENWKSIDDFDEKRKAKAAFLYLEKKGLVRPLREATKGLARGWQGSKEKDKDKEQEQEKERDTDKNQNLILKSLEAENGANYNREIFPRPSLP